MKQRGRGAIITMAWPPGRRADARAQIPYGAAKAAIALMTQDVAAQAGPSGIRVNCIAPETILTARMHQQIPAAQQAAMAEFTRFGASAPPKTPPAPPCSWPPMPRPGSPAWSSTSPAAQ